VSGQSALSARNAAAPVRLIINADDLGLACSVNRGIIETIETGVVTSTSLLMNMAACDDAIQRLRDARVRGAAPSVGLHFNIVTGRPLGACPTLTHPRTGMFLSLPVLAVKAFAGRLDIRDVEREVDAQLARADELLAPLGMRVTHIDSHQHAHCLPGVFDVVVCAAQGRGIAHVRHPYESPTLLRRPRAVLASHLLRAVVATRGGAVKALDDVRFSGIAAMGSHTFDRDIGELLSALLPGTTELMVHPGYDSPELAAIDSYRAPREREVRALTSPALRSRIEALGVTLTCFGPPSL
jgi:predicted glycoside hydrolase/deacetylase ChbG (UPF0249 family)